MKMKAMMPPAFRYRVRWPWFMVLLLPAPTLYSFMKDDLVWVEEVEGRLLWRSAFSKGSKVLLLLRGKESEVRRRGALVNGK